MAIATAAAPSVSAFGTRRLHKSQTDADSTRLATATADTGGGQVIGNTSLAANPVHPALGASGVLTEADNGKITSI
jgi:hypothetical protein